MPDSTVQRVLIADDDKFVRELVVHLLANQGIDVTQVEDGAAAIERLEQGFDAAIVDLDMPHATGLKGSNLKPDYMPKGMFATGVPHKITVVKKERDLFMKFENAEQTVYFHMGNPDLPPITQGRIGLRHMFTRSARYKNFRISKPE